MNLSQQIEAVKKERDRKKHCLPKMVEEGRISETQAAFQIQAMQAVYETLSQLQGIALRT